jgi:hypothetical protein
LARCSWGHHRPSRHHLFQPLIEGRKGFFSKSTPPEKIFFPLLALG